MPPLAIEATRCSTSSGICAAWAAAIKLSDIAASAMLMPPEADPVMPANRVTLIASFSSGLGIADSACDSTKKPGSAAITAPKPYSEAVFIAARIAPPTAVLLPSASRPRILRKPNTTTSRIPDTSAASTAQMAVIFATSVVIGLASPGSVSSWLAPYHCGIQWVKPRLNTPTKINGRIAISGFGRLMSSGGFRLVQQIGTVPFSLQLRLAPLAFKIQQTDRDDEQRADQPQPGARPRHWCRRSWSG